MHEPRTRLVECGPRARRAHDEPAVRRPRGAQQLEQVVLEQLWHLPPTQQRSAGTGNMPHWSALTGCQASQHGKSCRAPLPWPCSRGWATRHTRALVSLQPHRLHDNAAGQCKSAFSTQKARNSLSVPSSRWPGVAPSPQSANRTGTAACRRSCRGSTPGSRRTPCHSWLPRPAACHKPHADTCASTSCTLATASPTQSQRAASAAKLPKSRAAPRVILSHNTQHDWRLSCKAHLALVCPISAGMFAGQGKLISAPEPR